jgi:hypothetical protein
MGSVTDNVITAIMDNRTKFEAFCRSLTPEQLGRPVPDSTWVVRDFAAHLATLDPALVQIFQATARGEKFTGPDGSESFDLDGMNDALVEERRTWPLDRVFEEAAANRAPLIDAVRAITDEQAQNQMWFGGDAKRPAGFVPFNLFLAGWAQHDPIHAADMLKALPELAADAGITAWVENPFVKGYQAMMNH